MTPIDNAVLSEMLDNCLSDIKYLRAEVAALREAKAEAKAEAYETNEELADAEADAEFLRERIAEDAALIKSLNESVKLNERKVVDLYAECDKLEAALRQDGKLLDEQAERIAELEHALKRAIARADENADKLTASVKQAQAWADKYNRSERQVEDLRAELQRHKEALHISIRETSDLEDHLALYQDNCECAL